MARTPEAKVKAQIKKIIKEFGLYYYMPVPGGRGRNGVPDFLVCCFGAFMGIEAKAGNNPLTKLQEREGAAITKAGGWFIDVNEHRLDDLRGLFELIINLGQKNKEASRARFKEALNELEKNDDAANDDDAEEKPDE